MPATRPDAFTRLSVTSNHLDGVLLNVAASALFAVLYAYTHLLAPLDGSAPQPSAARPCRHPV
ncbi:MAG: hypothetical protein Q4E06_05350 [Lautropia sp.]|nr:hypothetical protein [Lautropia sp.]